MDQPRKPLPNGVTVPEQSIMDEEMYEHIYAVVSNSKQRQLLRELDKSKIHFESLCIDTRFDSLIDAGLAVWRTGSSGERPYVRLTSLGEPFVEGDVDSGIRELVSGENTVTEKYSEEYSE